MIDKRTRTSNAYRAPIYGRDRVGNEVALKLVDTTSPIEKLAGEHSFKLARVPLPLAFINVFAEEQCDA